MILVDTSILVDYLRKPDPHVARLFQDHAAAICGVIRAELLCGARADSDAQSLNRALDGFTNLPMTEDIWIKLGFNLARLRTAGLPVPFQDALIATVALHYDLPLWSRDVHYALIQPVLNLSLFDAPKP